jgi:hypothetical protein
MLDLDFTLELPAPPAGCRDRFGGRWRLVGAGAFDVWRYGTLELPAPSGRLLMRGPNGAGKTTALEALWPYLLDLNAAKLGAGKARQTTLKQLMADGGPARGRRYGYLWLTFATPDSEVARAPGQSTVSFGVRLQYSPSSAPAVKPVPFTLPGRPLRELSLTGAGGSALEHEEFCSRVQDVGGQVFDTPEEYVEHLAARVWATSAGELRDLAERLRQIRNPSLLGEVSPAGAADALRQSLPGVSPDVLTATADALAESEATREAFEADEHAAAALAEFARAWAGHVVEVTRAAHEAALDAATEVGERAATVTTAEAALADATTAAERTAEAANRIDGELTQARAAARAIELSDVYQAHGRISDLRGRLEAETATVAALTNALAEAATRARERTSAAREQLQSASDELAELAREAAAVGAPPTATDTIVRWHDRPRGIRAVANTVADPGPGLDVTFHPNTLDQLGRRWTAAAGVAKANAGRAHLLLRDRQGVDTAEQVATRARVSADSAEAEHDRARQAADSAQAAARDAARTLLADIVDWAPRHPHLRGLGKPIEANLAVWDADDITVLAAAEPSAVLTEADQWAHAVLRAGEALAAGHDADAKTADAAAAAATTQAGELREQASALRAGQLLPLPRPEWAGPGDDETAFGAALEWPERTQRPQAAAGGDADDEQAYPALHASRSRLELALAAAGILGAHLSADGAATDTWTISASGDPVELNLTAVLAVNPEHPYADSARAVLARIGLADAAFAGAGLVIGRDGTYAAGPLIGDPTAAMAAAGQLLPAAGHVGARTRLARALARAAELEDQASALDHQAQQHLATAAGHRSDRDAVRSQAASFPSRSALVKAESRRAGETERASGLERAAATARETADAKTTEHARLLEDWLDRARAMNMPSDPRELQMRMDTDRATATAMTRSADRLRDRVTVRLRRAVAAVPNEEEVATALARAASGAQAAHHAAAQTQALLTEAETPGDSDDAVRRFAEVSARASRLEKDLPPARETEKTAAATASRCEAELAAAAAALASVHPRQVASEAHLIALLSFPPVAHALGVADLPTQARRADANSASDADHAARSTLPTGDELLEMVDALLTGKRTAGRKMLGERYDEVRAALAQTWAIARADPPDALEELESFVLTHAETQYDPPRAATKASALADRARAALDAAEATALRDFVIGRLPSAIGTAWAALMDWKASVNAKMRAAQASSGVGVQVQIGLREDLDATARTVWELSCTVGDAVRTEAQKQQIGTALQALIAAADGTSMTERLATAADIRDWVDVHYLVERPGPGGVRSQRRWGSRTGLSGGERRLVVLAPMLAAIAANYDRFADAGLRLVPLDEVPAEVDEHGREGLARYLAELDLDVVCTSYLWDGAPGAWDGIDAHDLEAGADGTVVAFPMVIRGVDALPGDDPAVIETLVSASDGGRADSAP